jgi:hypothetical protein
MDVIRLQELETAQFARLGRGLVVGEVELARCLWIENRGRSRSTSGQQRRQVLSTHKRVGESDIDIRDPTKTYNLTVSDDQRKHSHTQMRYDLESHVPAECVSATFTSSCASTATPRTYPIVIMRLIKASMNAQRRN